MTYVDPAAIGAAVTSGIATSQQRQQQELMAKIQRAASAAAGLASVEDMKEGALAYIALAQSSPGEFTTDHLRVFMQTTYPAANAADIDAAIRAAEGSL